jgi:hypothetical protein
MNVPFRTALIGLTLLTPLATGCAGRTAPFDEMDKAQITVLRLQGPPPPVAPVAGAPGMPAIPGLPPEWQAGAQQALGQLQQVLPPGLIPPGLIPGAPGQPAAPAAPPPMFKGFVIGQQMPLTDETTREELLDIFGSEDSFNGNRGQCFTPGMGVSIVRADQPQPIDLLISINCNQAMGDGFRWPYPNNGFTPETAQKLQAIYQKLFGPVPPTGA